MDGKGKEERIDGKRRGKKGRVMMGKKGKGLRGTNDDGVDDREEEMEIRRKRKTKWTDGRRGLRRKGDDGVDGRKGKRRKDP